jgi:hypothetical protein
VGGDAVHADALGDAYRQVVVDVGQVPYDALADEDLRDLAELGPERGG